MAKKKDESEQNAPEQGQGEVNELNQEVSEPQTQATAEQAEQEGRVANNGDVSDPGNSGLIGENFTEGSVTGQADKPNG